MVTRKLMIAAVAAVLPFQVSAMAAQPAAASPACAAPQPPMDEFAAWGSPVGITAAQDIAGLAAAGVKVGQAADLALHPVESVRLPVPAGRAGGNGGLVSVEIVTAGTYRVALGTAAWVDVVAEGKAVASTAHGHGAPCSGIRKIVDFPLPAGRHAIAISGNAEGRTRLLVVRAPDRKQ